MISLWSHIASKYVKRNLKEKRHYFRYIGEESVLCMHRKKIYVKDVVSNILARSLFSFIVFLLTIIKRNLLSMIYFFLYITFEQYHRCHQILLCVHIDCDIKGEEVILRKTLKKKWSHKCASVEHQTPKTNHPIHLIHFKLHT